MRGQKTCCTWSRKEARFHSKDWLGCRPDSNCPSGSGDIVDRLSLRGGFQITRAAFTNSETQARIDALSRRGQGEPRDEEISDVPSNIRGSLQVTDANAYFSPLEFAVPGALVSLKGWYGVRTE